MVTVAAVIPAFNEAPTIAATVAEVLGMAEVDQVYVVDDGSTDGTAELAHEAGATVLLVENNSGKGGAIRKSLTMIEAEVYLFIDGDVGETAREGVKLLRPVLAGEADMTIGVFPRRPGKGGFGLAKGFAVRAIKLLTGRAVEEPLSGQRAVTKELITRLRFDDGYGLETGITIDALRAGASVVEVPVEMTHAYTGRDLAGFAHRGRQLAAITRAVISRALSRGRPLPVGERSQDGVQQDGVRRTGAPQAGAKRSDRS